jgi:hypothetical protein
LLGLHLGGGILRIGIGLGLLGLIIRPGLLLPALLQGGSGVKDTGCHYYGHGCGFNPHRRAPSCDLDLWIASKTPSTWRYAAVDPGREVSALAFAVPGAQAFCQSSQPRPSLACRSLVGIIRQGFESGAALRQISSHHQANGQVSALDEWCSASA